jgi:hypothetical protein
MPPRALPWVALCAIPLIAGSALAQTTWDGGGDGVSWSDAANWDPDSVPDAATDVVLDGGVSISLDVNAATAALTLDDATLDGPGDLLVTGPFIWGIGTLSGAGVATLTGGLTLLDGTTKLVARDVEALCDVVWHPSDLLFDTAIGPIFRHHAGFTFSIVGPGGDRMGGARGAGHRDAPLVGEDPRADDTDVYSLVFGGTVDDQAGATHQMSIDVGGFYGLAAAAVAAFQAGSRLRPDATLSLGDASELVYRRGTHVVSGAQEVADGFPAGARVTGDATSVQLATLTSAAYPYAVEGSLTASGDVSLSSLRLDNGSIIGTGIFTVGEVRVDPSESVALAQVYADLVAQSLDWRGGGIELGPGVSASVQDLTIDHDDTGLSIFGETDPEGLSTLEVTGTMTVAATASVPPRIEAAFMVDAQGELHLTAGTRLVLRQLANLPGIIRLDEGSELEVSSGTTTVTETTETIGLGQFTVGQNGVLRMISAALGFPAEIEGTVDINNDNVLQRMRLLDGQIEGTGTLTTQLEMNPLSPAHSAVIQGVSVRITDGSRWVTGRLILSDGGELVVVEDATFMIEQTASNLSMTDDGDPTDMEAFRVEGTTIVQETGSPPPSFTLPVNVSSTGTVEIAPDAGSTFGGVATVLGTLRVREDGTARFIFNDHQLLEGGLLEGAGTIRIELGGTFALGGTVSPGEDGVPGTMNVVGPFMLEPTSTTVINVSPEGVNSNVAVAGNATFGGNLGIRFAAPPTTDTSAFSVATVTGSQFEGYDGLTIDGSDGSELDEITYDGGEVTVRISNDPSLGLVSGYVYWDLRDDGFTPSIDPTLGGWTITREVDGSLVQSYTSDRSTGWTASGLATAPVEHVFRLQPMEGWTGAGLKAYSFPAGTTIVDADFGTRLYAGFTYVVSDPGDSGPGTLRQAIIDATEAGGFLYGIEIGQVSEPIFIQSDLPPLTARVEITTDVVQEDRLGEPVTRLIIDGSQCADCTDGLVVTAGGSILSGITVQNFPGNGIVLDNPGESIVHDVEVTGNGLDGIRILSGDNHVVSSADDPDQRSAIVGNGGAGISVLGGSGHRLQLNRIEQNGGLAIDLGGDGVSPADPLDADLGPNHGQNAPEVVAVSMDGTLVDVTLESRPLTFYDIHVYGANACHESGTGESERLLGHATVLTDVAGIGSLTVSSVPHDGEVSATATDPAGSTSEMSACFTADVLDTGVIGPAVALPASYPNPAPGRWTLAFSVPGRQWVSARIYDVAGRKVRVLHDGVLPEGHHQLRWDGELAGGRRAGAGIFFYKLAIGGEIYEGRLVRLGSVR